jgi:hypothetical protein
MKGAAKLRPAGIMMPSTAEAPALGRTGASLSQFLGGAWWLASDKARELGWIGDARNPAAWILAESLSADNADCGSVVMLGGVLGCPSPIQPPIG